MSAVRRGVVPGLLGDGLPVLDSPLLPGGGRRPASSRRITSLHPAAQWVVQVVGMTRCR